jgi:glycosyltransferase involved in cell wall biosynthesis
MRLSIITINYNNRTGLQKTVDSVIDQTCKDFEWIVIDGGSTDGCKELIEQYQDAITYWCSEPDRGIFNAMNKGVKHANGAYCLFLNSGDRLHDNHVIEKVIPHLSDSDFITGNECVVDSQYEEVRIRKNPEAFDKYQLLIGCLWHQSTFIRTCLLKERPYDETFKVVGDWETTFYQLVLNNKTYKHIDILVSDFVEGGISTDLKYAREESKRMIDSCLSQREQDTIALAFFSKKGTESDKRQISEIAYTAFANDYYQRQDFIEVFAPYKEILVRYSTLHHRLFNLMCLSGQMRMARLLYRLLSKKV